MDEDNFLNAATDDPFGPYWSRSLKIKLIELYKQNTVLWDTTNPNYHSRGDKHEAWRAIGQELGFPASAVKRKITNILGCYRRYKSRLRQTSGPRRYVMPKWFGFKLLAFLETNKGGNIYVDEDSSLQTTQDKPQNALKPPKKKQGFVPIKNNNSKHWNVKAINKSTAKPKATGAIINISHEEIVRKINEDIDVSDQYYIYGLYIANELRKYDQVMLAHVKHSINKIIFEADLKRIAENGEASHPAERSDPLEEYEIVYGGVEGGEEVKTESIYDSDD